MKHSRACCKVVSVEQVEFDGLMRPKSFNELTLSCSQMPELEFKGYLHQAIMVPIFGYRIRLRLKEFMLRRIAAQTMKYLANLKKRQ